jgi:1-acyl-sn-glycerol-3-phosphate acyltransferase
MLMHSLAAVSVTGIDQIPAAGPVLLAINHQSLLDGPLVLGELSRPVSCLVKAEAFTPWLGPILRSAGQISLVRQRLDPGPVRLCVAILRAGGVVGIFPEGTRGDGSARTAKPGVGYLALRSGATVVPVACHGTAQVLSRGPLRRRPLRLVCGEPIVVSKFPDDRLLNRRHVATLSEQIRSALAALVESTRPIAAQEVQMPHDPGRHEAGPHQGRPPPAGRERSRPQRTRMTP